MKRKIIFLAIVLGCALGVPSAHADNASLSFSPSSGTYPVGATFSVSIVVSSPTEAVNAFSGDITYPNSTLAVTGLSKEGSVVDFWTTDPTGANGVIHYEGITLNPGYTGSNGKLLTVTFEALAPGTATLKFSAASVLANDGLGTNLISTTSTAAFTVTSAQVQPQTPTVAAAGLPAAPVITSSTHPDQDAWYSARVAQLSWPLPEGVDDVAYITNAYPTYTPHASFGLVKGRSTPTLADGIWYTHVRFHNSLGWGPVSDFKTQIDGTPPTSINVQQDTGPDSAVKKLELTASDALSGIAQFGVTLNGGTEVLVPAETDGSPTLYSTDALAPGTYSLLVKAYDRAGNSLAYTGSFDISEIEPPTITEYQKTLRDQDFLVIRGTTYPNITVSFSITRQLPVREGFFGPEIYVAAGAPITATAISDANGNFVFAYENRLAYGLYQINARAVLADGTTSAPSPTIVIPVIATLFMRIIHAIFTPLGMSIACLCAMLLFLFLLIFTHRRYRELKQKTAELEKREVVQVKD